MRRPVSDGMVNNETSLWRVFLLVAMGCFRPLFDGLSSELNTNLFSFAIQSTRRLNERCAYESGQHRDGASHADCAGRHPGRCVSDSRGDGRSPVFAGQEGELDGSLRTVGSCGSTALADSGNSGGVGAIDGGEGTRPGGRAACGSRSRPGVLAVTEAGKP